MNRAIDYILAVDLTVEYAVLVWTAVFLCLVWSILLPDDPANKALPRWELRIRTWSMTVMVAGLLLSVLFGGDQKWQPWPTMLVTAFGLDLYLAGAILSVRHRIKSFQVVSLDGRRFVRN